MQPPFGTRARAHAHDGARRWCHDGRERRLATLRVLRRVPPAGPPLPALAAGGHLIEVCRDCWLLREIARLLPLVRAWGEHALIVEALIERYRLVRACSADEP